MCTLGLDTLPPPRWSGSSFDQNYCWLLKRWFLWNNQSFLSWLHSRFPGLSLDLFPLCRFTQSSGLFLLSMLEVKPDACLCEIFFRFYFRNNVAPGKLLAHPLYHSKRTVKYSRSLHCRSSSWHAPALDQRVFLSTPSIPYTCGNCLCLCLLPQSLYVLIGNDGAVKSWLPTCLPLLISPGPHFRSQTM
jgi:hypothetical protein